MVLRPIVVGIYLGKILKEGEEFIQHLKNSSWKMMKHLYAKKGDVINLQ